VFLALADRPVLIVGGGAVAARKAEALLAAGARVTVNAPRLGRSLLRLLASGRLRHAAGEFDPRHLDGCAFAIAATDDSATNGRVASAAAEAGIFVNVVDDGSRSSAVLPAVVRRGALTVAIGTGGAAPAIASRLRAAIETVLDSAWAGILALAAGYRQRIRDRFPDLRERRRVYDWMLDGPVARALRAGRSADASRVLDGALAGGADPIKAGGSVALVGAGPGDPGLLTLNALRLLQQADVVLHDHLVPPGVLALARRDAERIPVGKQAGEASAAQSDINALMVQLARAGNRVVRLKGGDPFVFGRGGEELEHLRANGVPYEVVPGITAALGCAAYAGIPLTHRELAHSVELVTAHERGGGDAVEWERLARVPHTLVFYMGVANAARVQARLLAAGRDADTPVAVIENGTTPAQRVFTATLARLGALVDGEAIRSPALLVVGEVAAKATSLGWFGAAAQAPAHGQGALAEVA
jgi:uroporphyrin-III C-methyltransferase/precorrin-2 dehydrogenase/sirohydrochlorin ferrochelatase